MCAETANGTSKALENQKLTLYRSPSRASGDGANWASPQDTKQNCGSIVNGKTCESSCRRRARLSSPGRCERIFAMTTANLLAEANLSVSFLPFLSLSCCAPPTANNCTATAEEQHHADFCLFWRTRRGKTIGPFSGTSLVAAGATGTCAAEGGAVEAAQPAAAA